MSVRHLALIVSVLLGCGTPPPPASPNVSSDRPESKPAEPPKPLPSLAARCDSPAIDMRWLATQDTTCPMDGGKALGELADGTVTLSVEPEQIAVAPGATATADYVIRNVSDQTVELSLNAFCTAASTSYEITDADGAPVDRTPCQRAGGGCSGATRVVSLHPGGDARMRFEISAHRRIWNGCNDKSLEPLQPGHYRVTLNLADPFDSVTGSFTVTPPREPPRI